MGSRLLLVGFFSHSGEVRAWFLVLQQEHPTCVHSTQYAKALYSRTGKCLSCSACAEGPQSCQHLLWIAELLLAWGRALTSHTNPSWGDATLKKKHMEIGLFPAAPSLPPFHWCQVHGGRETSLISCHATVTSCFCEAVRMAPPSKSSVFPVINTMIQLHLPATGGSWKQVGWCWRWQSPSLHNAPCQSPYPGAGDAFAFGFLLPSSRGSCHRRALTPEVVFCPSWDERNSLPCFLSSPSQVSAVASSLPAQYHSQLSCFAPSLCCGWLCFPIHRSLELL